MKYLIGATAVLLAGCATTDYEPVRERSFDQLVSDGCRSEGEQMIVTGQVSRAYQDTLVLWNGIDPRATVAVSLPEPSVGQRVRGWFGDTRNEFSEQRLSDLAARGVPISVTLLCRGPGLAPVAQTITYTNEEGQRIAIGY